MSAIERRIADFLLENAHLLRDYSSQQLADALQISQSSVVKFSQKLGYKGYPDLKYSVGEAIARASGSKEVVKVGSGKRIAPGAMVESLWQDKSKAEEETRLINERERLDALAHALHRAGKLFLVGLGADGVSAQGFALQLAMLGLVTVCLNDPVLMMANLSAMSKQDVLIAFCEQGQHPALNQLARQFREQQGKIVSITRHTANPLRAHADFSLIVSAHDERSYIEPLLYRSALQHLLDAIFVTLCEDERGRRALLGANLERVGHLLDPKM